MVKPKNLQTNILSWSLSESSTTKLFYKRSRFSAQGTDAKISILENFESHDRIVNEMYKIYIQLRYVDINLEYRYSFDISSWEILKLFGNIHLLSFASSDLLRPWASQFPSEYLSLFPFVKQNGNSSKQICLSSSEIASNGVT